MVPWKYIIIHLGFCIFGKKTKESIGWVGKFPDGNLYIVEEFVIITYISVIPSLFREIGLRFRLKLPAIFEFAMLLMLNWHYIPLLGHLLQKRFINSSYASYVERVFKNVLMEHESVRKRKKIMTFMLLINYILYVGWKYSSFPWLSSWVSAMWRITKCGHSTWGKKTMSAYMANSPTKSTLLWILMEWRPFSFKLGVKLDVLNGSSGTRIKSHQWNDGYTRLKASMIIIPSPTRRSGIIEGASCLVWCKTQRWSTPQRSEVSTMTARFWEMEKSSILECNFQPFHQRPSTWNAQRSSPAPKASKSHDFIALWFKAINGLYSLSSFPSIKIVWHWKIWYLKYFA